MKILRYETLVVIHVGTSHRLAWELVTKLVRDLGVSWKLASCPYQQYYLFCVCLMLTKNLSFNLLFKQACVKYE